MKKEFPPITEPLLAWYDRQARILPWRETPLPYYVWLSEIMLQQTRVEAVLPFFRRFVETLPSIENLAKAPEDLLLKLWEGLGYYNRVRNLQKAARIVVEKYQGCLPSTVEALEALPGIGAYTAGAIASIAYGIPAPAVDGNVLRVYSRLAEDEDTLQDPAGRKAVSDAVMAVQPEERCGDFNQALMELGALICLPNGQPKCDLCPVAHLCKAHAQGRELQFPKKMAKAPRKKEERTVFLLFCDGAVAIRKRPKKGLLAGLWEFPNVVGRLDAEAAESFIQEWGIVPASFSYCGDGRHIFSHVEWNMVGYWGICKKRAAIADVQWVTKEALKHSISMPSAFRVFLDLARENWPQERIDI